MKIVEGLEQGTPKWYDYRHRHVMATCSGVIAGEMRRFGRTPLKLWQEKVSGESQVIENENMRLGKELEPLAREHFTKLTAIDVVPTVIESAEHSWAAASLDGLSHDQKYVVEIKVHKPEIYAKTLQGYVPEYYKPQFQKQLYVSELDFLYYFPYDGSHGHVVKIYRDDDYIKKMIAAEKIFWDAVCNLEPPEECEEDFEVIQNPFLINLSESYVQIKDRIKELEMEEEELKEEILKRISGKNVICGPLKMQKVYRKGAVEYKAIPELSGVNLDQYRKKPTEYMLIRDIS